MTSYCSNNKNEFSNEEVIINFVPDGYLVKKVNNKIFNNDYFNKYNKFFKFCKMSPLPEYMQQPSSSDGWFCHFYVLPYEPEDKVKSFIPSMYQKNRFSRKFEVKTIKINKFNVLRWRYQIGKTRLEHFLVLGNQYNYLFISSPYGESSRVLQVIRTMRFK